MRQQLLDDSLSPLINPAEPRTSPLFARREFLQTLGVAGLGLAFAHTGASAAAFKTSAGVWRDCVTGFVETVCDGQARAINARLGRATLEYAPAPTNFHSRFSAPFVFVQPISSVPARCRNGFEVNQFPLYGIPPCESCNDLNSTEIRRISNSKEIDYYRCVVAPVGERKDRYNHAVYTRAMENYGYNRDEFDVIYARDFRTSGDEIVPGFYIGHKTQRGPTGKRPVDLLLAEPVTA